MTQSLKYCSSIYRLSCIMGLRTRFYYQTVWCRRTDELVDGPNASHITPKALDRWEKRLTDLFQGQPYDLYDVALSHTVTTYPVDIQVNPFCFHMSVSYPFFFLQQHCVDSTYIGSN